MVDVMEAPAEEQVSEGAIEVVDTKPVKVKPRTKQLSEREEKQLFTLFATAEHAERLILLEAFEGKAHLAVGMDNFETYCRERLGLTYDASYLSRLVKAARFERQITGRSFNSLKLGEAIDEKEVKKLPPLRSVLEITRVPDEKKWIQVYEEHNALRLSNEGVTLTPIQQAAELKKIVAREIRAENPDAPRPGRKPGEGRKAAEPTEATPTASNGTSKPKSHAPVTGETYDGSEEQQAIEHGSVSYTEAVERMTKAESFITTFLSIMQSDEMDVQALNELFNDCTAYQSQYGL